MTSLDGFLPMSHDPLIMWPCEIRGLLTGRGSARKRLSCQQLVTSAIIKTEDFRYSNSELLTLTKSCSSKHKTIIQRF